MKIHKGFTLIELLATLFILSLLISFSYRAISTLSKAQQLIQSDVDDLNTLQKTLLLWEQDTQQLFYENDLTISVQQKNISEERLLSIQCCYYSSGSGQYFQNESQERVQRLYVAYYLKNNVLYRRMLSKPADIESEFIRSAVLLANINQARVEPLLMSDIGKNSNNFTPSFYGLKLMLSHESLGSVERIVFTRYTNTKNLQKELRNIIPDSTDVGGGNNNNGN